MSSRTTKRSKSKSTPVRRRPRARGTPKWIQTQKDLDEVARRRCLMVLSVLSGERPVTEAIAEAQISRQLYYLLEDKALRAMIAVLTPSSTGESGVSVAESPAKRIAELEAKVSKLEKEKRRSERLLLLTRKIVRPGPIKTSSGGRPRRTSRSSRKGPASTTRGPKPSPASRATSATATTEPTTPSTPTPDGEAVQ